MEKLNHENKWRHIIDAFWAKYNKDLAKQKLTDIKDINKFWLLIYQKPFDLMLREMNVEYKNLYHANNNKS